MKSELRWIWWKKSNPFLKAEDDAEAAYHRAKVHIEFWSLVYSGNGLSYRDCAEMDLFEFREAVEAKKIYIEMLKEARENQ